MDRPILRVRLRLSIGEQPPRPQQTGFRTRDPLPRNRGFPAPAYPTTIRNSAKGSDHQLATSANLWDRPWDLYPNYRHSPRRACREHRTAPPL